MIVVYPMLTSKNVSTLVLPGICKALERLILIYDMESVAKRSGLGNLIGTAIKIAEADRVSEVTFKPREPEYDDSTEDPYEEKEKNPRGGSKKGTKEVADQLTQGTSFELSSTKIMSIEPTWVEVKSGLGTSIIGIKVIPFSVKPSQNMGTMMFSDSLQKSFDLYFLGMKRKLQKSVYSFIRYLKSVLPGGFGTDLTGDPEKDIIMASTKYKSNTFALLSLADLEKDDLFHSAGGVSKLFYLGWSSILIADDVNKVMTCCMKQFGGLCTQISYSQLYANFGREHQKVYEDMDDLKKTTTPFFRNKVKPAKLFSEQLIAEKMSKYSGYSDCVFCDEE